MRKKREFMIMKESISGVDLAYRLCRDFGATNKELAAFFRVSERVIYNWQNKIPEFRDALKRGKDECDTSRVEASLYRRAVGYFYEDCTRELRQNEEGTPVLVTTKVVTKHIPADPVAMIFWLKNRGPDRWKDRIQREVDLKGKREITVTSSIPEPEPPLAETPRSR